MRQFTKEQAVKIYKSGIWKDMTFKQLVDLQLFQNLLCIPFDKFHEAMEKVLNRSVWTHEFAFFEDLEKEYLGKKEKPTFEEIINLIPKEKRIILEI